MSRKEFEIFRLSLEKEKFPKVVSDPIEYGIQRAMFKRQRLKKLIGIGKNIRSRTIQAKVERWKRQLEKLGHSQEHLASLKREMEGARLELSNFEANALRPIPADSKNRFLSTNP